MTRRSGIECLFLLLQASRFGLLYGLAVGQSVF